MMTTLARNWWAFALRGVAAILFGVLAILLPGITLTTLVLLLAAYLLLDGVLAIVAGFRAAERHERWWPFALEGAADIVAGVLAFALPLPTAFLLVVLVAVWALVTGVLMLAAGFKAGRRQGGRWLLFLNGAVSVMLGVLMLVQPIAGALTLAWIVGVYALVFGAALLALAFRLRRAGAGLGEWPRYSSSSGTPRRA